MFDDLPPKCKEYMRRALELAKEAADRGEVPVGALVVHRGEVVAEAFNLRETENDPTAHAEILAMRSAAQKLGSWRLDECVLYVTLEPCPMCAGALVNARLGTLVYGAKDPKAGYVGSLYNVLEDTRLNHKVRAFDGVLADECGAVLKDFFRARREAKKHEKEREHPAIPG